MALTVYFLDQNKHICCGKSFLNNLQFDYKVLYKFIYLNFYHNLPDAFNIHKKLINNKCNQFQFQYQQQVLAYRTKDIDLPIIIVQYSKPPTCSLSPPGCGIFAMKIELNGPKCFWFMGKEIKPDRNQIGKSLQRQRQQHQQLQQKH